MSKDTEGEAGQEQKVPAQRVCPNFPHPAAHLYSLLAGALAFTALSSHLWYFSTTWFIFFFFFFLQPTLSFCFVLVFYLFTFQVTWSSSRRNRLCIFTTWQRLVDESCTPLYSAISVASCRTAGNLGRLIPESLASFLPHCFITDRGLADSTYARRCYSVL